MKHKTLGEEIAHSFMHSFGRIIKSLNPRAYESIRWKFAKMRLMNNIFGNPMYQQLLLPFVVQKGDTVFDIGANTGQLTLSLAHLVGKNGTVHAFEPISKNFSRLRENIEHENLTSRVILNQLALGDSKKFINFIIPQERYQETSLVPHNQESWADYCNEPDKYTAERCKITTLDSYVKENNIGAISFIKCDVEGAELQVMKGAKVLLRSPNPPVLMLEVFEGWTKDFGYHPRELFGFLNKDILFL